MFFEKNSQSLQHSIAPSVLTDLVQTPIATNLEMAQTEAGDYTLFWIQPNAQPVALHDVKGSASEAKRIIESSCHPALNRVRLILGLGLGYLLEALFDSKTIGGAGKVFIYEPDLSRLKFLLTNVDYSAYWVSGHVILLTSMADLLEAIRQAILPDSSDQTPFDILITPGYAFLLNAEIPTLMNALTACVEERIRDYQTGLHFHWQWLKQFFQNWPYLNQTLPITKVNNQFKGRPALIIGRGPSLDAVIDTLREIADQAILIATGSTLRRLWESGITPDFAVFYDANGLAEQLHGLPGEFLQKVTFVLSPLVQSLAFTTPSKAQLLFFPESAASIAEWFLKAFPSWNSSQPVPLQECLLEGGGTVSLLAFQLAQKMGCDPLILVGQDLAFPNLKAYAGSIAVQVDEAGQLSLQSSDTLYAKPSAMSMVPSQQGDMLPSLKAYIGFIHHFERLAQKNTHAKEPRQLINASIGGAQIKGYSCESLQQLRDRGVFNQKKEFQSVFSSNPFPFIGKETDHQHDQNSNSSQEALTRLHQQINALISAIQTILNAPEINISQKQMESLAQPFFQQLEQQPFLAYCLMFDMLTLQRQYDVGNQILESANQNWALFRRTSENCLSSLKQLLSYVSPPPNPTTPLQGSRGF